jgi:hypothetical protein
MLEKRGTRSTWSRMVPPRSRRCTPGSWDLVLIDRQMPLVDLAGELSRRGRRRPFTFALTADARLG